MATPSSIGQSLTPAEKSADVTNQAMQEGLFNGLLTLLPSSGAVYIAMKQSPGFRARTNMQSRTALAIMPALFAFGFTSERKLDHEMREMARKNQHTHDTVHWAEQQQIKQQKENMAAMTDQAALTELYRKSVEESGVNIVPGDRLQWYHVGANYAAANPLKVLGGLAVPAVALIFYGNTGKEHLQFSVKVLHTRVFGQFATISLLLSVMAFKEFMDRNGRFISQAEADERVQEMHEVRQHLLARLEAQIAAQQAAKDEIAAAHEQDVLDHNVHTVVKKHKKKQQQNEEE